MATKAELLRIVDTNESFDKLMEYNTRTQENLQKMMEYDLFEFEDYCKNCYEFIEKRRPDQILQIWEKAKVLNNV